MVELWHRSPQKAIGLQSQCHNSGDATIEDTWDKQKRLNMADGTGVVFGDVAEHFTGNFDES